VSAALAAAAASPGRSWLHVLLGAVRPEFRAEVYVPDAGDRVLCARPPTDALLARGRVKGCVVSGCRRSAYGLGLCHGHLRRWKQAGRPDLGRFVSEVGLVHTRHSFCVVADCGFAEAGGAGLCDVHERRFRRLRRYDRDVDPAGYVARLKASRGPRWPRFDTRGLGRVLTLELQYALQYRHDARGAALTPRIFGAVAGWARNVGVESLLDHGDRWWKHSAVGLRPELRGLTLAFLRYARNELQQLRERESGEECWEWDTWPVERVDPDGRWAHQPTRRIYFSDIEPPWLRALAKRWARWRLSAATKSPLSVSHTTSSLRRFCRWLEQADALPARPGELTRDSLERFLAHLRSDPGTGETRNRTIIVDLKVFLDDVRMLGWEPDLPISAVYHRAELSRQAKALPRFIDEFVMAQIESEEALSKLPDQTTRALVVLLMETGLRSVDAMRLLFDPITRDQAGAPYLVFWNHKLSREAIIPISERLLGELRRQQAQLRERFPDAPPPVLFPRPWANSGGHHPLPLSTLNRRLRNWLSDCDVRDPQGEPVKITSHQFRHTLGTRLVNNEVPLDTIRRLLDHASPTMTAVYAHVKDQTLRREWERYQQRLNIRGETIPLDADGPLSDAAWAKENLSRAKQTLPNGYCGLPLQQRCPHPNACLTCDSFLTTEEFLPQHREQLDRTRELIASARASGNDRLVDMNEPIELNLVRIIQGLNTLQEASSDAA
jgi:integrase